MSEYVPGLHKLDGLDAWGRERFVFNPVIRGSLAPRGKHEHLPRIISWTFFPSPLRVLMACAYCSKTEWISANKRLRKLQWGFTPETWAAFLVKGQERLDQIKAHEAAEREGGSNEAGEDPQGLVEPAMAAVR